MKESIRQERAKKLKATLQASVNHLQSGLNALEDANLHTTEDQEHDVDVFCTRMEDILQEMREMFSLE